jgi:hypothetical protein
MGISQKDRPQLFEPYTGVGRGRMKSSAARVRLHTDLTSSVDKRELTAPGRGKKQSQKVSNWRLPPSPKHGDHEMPSKTQDKCEVTLPNLAVKVELLKGEAKATFLHKKYKLFKMYLK